MCRVHRTHCWLSGCMWQRLQRHVPEPDARRHNCFARWHFAFGEAFRFCTQRENSTDSDAARCMIPCCVCAALRADNVACRLWCPIPKRGEASAIVDHTSVARKAVLTKGLDALGAPEEHPSSCSRFLSAMRALVVATSPPWAELLRVNGHACEAHRNRAEVAHDELTAVPA